ncbi:glycosyl hydrolase family 28-related protein [Spirosoma telluris]|uniref:glycosyl hydrolase family 28-related protein n=1 Tax=Spirosoma telluris TaxID=2183553 RepID=UPI0018DEC2AC
MKVTIANKTKGLVTLVAFCFTMYARAQTVTADTSPKLFQVTTAETLPGDAVLIRGEYLDHIKTIQVSRLADDPVNQDLPSYVPLPREDGLIAETRVKVNGLMENNVIEVDKLQQHAQSVKFIIPDKEKEGVYSVRLTDDNNGTTGFYLNAPKVNWVISEAGQKAVIGDYLRIQGKNLWRKGYQGQVVLLSTDTRQVVRVDVDKVFDAYSVSVTIPKNTPAGEYWLYYHNGQGGKTAWSEPLTLTVSAQSTNAWDKQVFNVTDYGAKGNGENNETAAFRAALDAAEKNGGGTIYIPRGRYKLTGELILPPYTMLKGESKELTQLFFSPLNWDTGELPNSLITGTHHFAVKSLTIWASRAWGIILLTGPPSEQGNITLENLIVRQSAEMSGMLYQIKANRDIVEAEIQSRWSQTGIILRGENIKLRNCDFNSSGMYTFFAVSGFIQHCKFTREGTGINQPYMLIHPKGLIFEDCYKQADGYGYAASIDESRNLYEARNVIPFNYTNDREAMTLDGGSGGYAGPIKNVYKDIITLPMEPIPISGHLINGLGGACLLLMAKVPDNTGVSSAIVWIPFDWISHFWLSQMQVL